MLTYQLKKQPGLPLYEALYRCIRSDILSGRLGDREITMEYLSYLDVLVDGPFVMAKKDLNLRFRGSSNQRLIDVPASLASGTVVLWKDWQEERKI